MDRLYRSEIPDIVKALGKQRVAERYVDQREHWAFLAAVITNGFQGLATSMSGKRRKPKLVKPDDFMDKDFRKMFHALFKEEKTRKCSLEKLIEDAKAKGLNGPWSKGGEMECK